MDIHTKTIITVLAVSLLIVGVAVPLALRWVPRNVIYGFRTRTTLSDDKLWYAANAYFGRKLIVATLLGCALTLAVLILFPLPPDLLTPVAVLFFAVTGLFATLATVRFVRRQSKLK
ncbi:MAG: hypothetical protein GC149_15015 [Gammaproteobacteria bacterium]|nr:hypothetical protein [Gammaproteobacteria bacterium]